MSQPTAPNPDADLAALTGGAVRTLTLAGREITLSPLKVKELPAFTKSIRPVAASLAEGSLTQALLTDMDAVIAATALAARVPRAWLDERDMDDLVTLAVAALEINADFFTRRVLPLLTTAAESLAGGTSPASSSTPATGTPT